MAEVTDDELARKIYEARFAHEPARCVTRWDDLPSEAVAIWHRCARAAREFGKDVAELAVLRARVAAFEKLINSPETDDWLEGARLEAAHQVERWGAAHDVGKSAWDWFWLIGFLAQKAAASQIAGDAFKAKHHTISTAAALLNWHRNLSGEDARMRPGIDPLARGIEMVRS